MRILETFHQSGQFSFSADKAAAGCITNRLVAEAKTHAEWDGDFEIVDLPRSCWRGRWLAMTHRYPLLAQLNIESWLKIQNPAERR